MSGTGGGGGGPLPTPVFGGEALAAAVTVTTVAPNWQNTGLQIVLPEAGAYRLGGVVQCRIAPTGPGGSGGWVYYRLFDVTAGVEVPRAGGLMQQTADSSESDYLSSPISTHYTVTQPTTLRLEGQGGVSGAGATNQIQVAGAPFAGTHVNFEKLVGS